MEANVTKFEALVKKYGAAKLATDMIGLGHSVSACAVYQWLRGQHEPRPNKQRDIVKLVKGLTLRDIGDHFVAKECQREAIGHAASNSQN